MPLNDQRYWFVWMHVMHEHTKLRLESNTRQMLQLREASLRMHADDMDSNHWIQLKVMHQN